MPRIRTIKPEFFRHHDLYLAEKESGLPIRVSFSGLWCCADKEGRFKWQPLQLKLDILPYDDVKFEDILSCLEEKGFIVRYVLTGKIYGYIPTFKEHQRIVGTERNYDSKLPPPQKIVLENFGNNLVIPSKQQGDNLESHSNTKTHEKKNQLTGNQNESYSDNLVIPSYQQGDNLVTQERNKEYGVRSKDIIYKLGDTPSTPLIIYPKPDDLKEIPNQKKNDLKNLIMATRHIEVSNEEVETIWLIFKNQNLTGEKQYNGYEDVYRHFINWGVRQPFRKKTGGIKTAKENNKISGIKFINDFTQCEMSDGSIQDLTKNQIAGATYNQINPNSIVKK